MKACIFHKPGQITVEEMPEPRPGRGDILLKMAAAGICHSDIRVYRGEKKARPGVTPGHENSGIIAALGDEVEGFRIGQPVVMCPILACDRCYYCQRGFRNRCLYRITLGYEENGGLAEYLLIPQRLVELGHVLPAPIGLPLKTASLTEPLACVLNSLEICRVQPGSSLLVMGAGPMGLLHVILARTLGVAKVIAVEPLAERRAYAQEFGATIVLDPNKDDVTREVMEVTDGLGADAAVVSIGLAKIVNDVLPLVRRQGYVNLFAGFPPGSIGEIDVNAVHYGELFLTGSQNATIDQYRRSAQLLPAMPGVDKVITHQYTIDEAPQAYMARQEREGLKSVIVFPED